MLNKKIVIVTGGANGIGRVISEKFAKEKAIVFIADIDKKNGEKIQNNIHAKGFSAIFVECDVSSELDITRLVKTIVYKKEKIDIIINNAGISSKDVTEKRSMSIWNKVLAVNLTAQYMLVKYALPYMNKGSSIINLSSTRAIMSEPNSEPYASSKAGILGLTHSLASSLSNKKIRVNAISPGWINVSGYKETKKDRDQHFVKRVGNADDIAEACLFLADNRKSGFITGQNIVIDGGMTKKMIYL